MVKIEGQKQWKEVLIGNDTLQGVRLDPFQSKEKTNLIFTRQNPRVIGGTTISSSPFGDNSFQNEEEEFEGEESKEDEQFEEEVCHGVDVERGGDPEEENGGVGVQVNLLDNGGAKGPQPPSQFVTKPKAHP